MDSSLTGQKIFIVEAKIREDGFFMWGSTSKEFHSREEAEKKIERLKEKYSFVYDYRVVTREKKTD